MISTPLSILLTRHPNGRTTVPQLGNMMICATCLNTVIFESPLMFLFFSNLVRAITLLEI